MPKISSTADTGMERSELSSREQKKLQQSYERSLEDTRTLDTQTLVEKLLEYRKEVRIAAEVARSELNGEFDGQSPESGNFGIDWIHPGYFGYDDWDNIPDVTAGAANDWLDSHTPDNLASGAGGDSFSDPLGVGEPAVHIILGIGTYNPSSAVTRVKFELNDQPETAVSTETEFRGTDMKIKWLDTPYLLRPDDNVAAMAYAGGEDGNTYSEALYPLGISFVEARYARVLDPANMAGTDDANIVIER